MVFLLEYIFFFYILLFKIAWLAAALETPSASPASVKLIYSVFSLVLPQAARPYLSINRGGGWGGPPPAILKIPL